MALEATAEEVLANFGSGSIGIEIPYLSIILKTIGGIATLYFIYLAMVIILNIKKNKELKKIRVLLEGIDKKIKGK